MQKEHPELSPAERATLVVKMGREIVDKERKERREAPEVVKALNFEGYFRMAHKNKISFTTAADLLLEVSPWNGNSIERESLVRLIAHFELMFE